MKVCITIAEKHDGTFQVLYCGGDTTQAMDACMGHNEPDTKEVCMFRKPFHYKRRAMTNDRIKNALARHLFAFQQLPEHERLGLPAPVAEVVAPAPETVATVEQVAGTFLDETPAPATEPITPKSRKRK